MLSVCIYADSTGLFKESECDSCNLVYMNFPEEIVRKYYEQNKEDFIEETSYELGIPEDECTFEDWYKSVYTAEDTNELYDFAIENGCIPKFGVEDHDAVFYRDDDNFKYIVFEGTYGECRQFGKENDWEYNGEELEILSEARGLWLL